MHAGTITIHTHTYMQIHVHMQMPAYQYYYYYYYFQIAHSMCSIATTKGHRRKVAIRRVGYAGLALVSCLVAATAAQGLSSCPVGSGCETASPSARNSEEGPQSATEELRWIGTALWRQALRKASAAARLRRAARGRALLLGIW